ncbi:MAG: hypothetical protein RL463_812 [Bacteroidota bacterium]|jgi:hypothetical protein
MYIRDPFRTPRAFIPPTACSTSAASVRVYSGDTTYVAVPSSDFLKDTEITLTCLTGDIHISTLTTAPTTNSYKLISGDVLNINIKDYLAMVSTSTGATFEAILWK